MVEELIFENIESSKKAFSKLNVYKKLQLNPSPLAPLNWLVFLKKERILILSSESFHKYPTQQTKYRSWILDNLFDGISQEVIEIHK